MDTLLQIVSRDLKKKDLNDIVIPRTQFLSVHADAGMWYAYILVMYLQST